MKSDSETRPVYRGGPNIAMKIPPGLYEATLQFYRDVVGLPLLNAYSPDHVFQYGPSLLWLDSVPGMERTEIWLELLTSDTAVAGEHFARWGVDRCDAVEPLPAGFDGFWIRSPASVVHLVAG